MKYFLSVVIMIISFARVNAQLTTKADCGTMVVDVYKGWINEVMPSADPERIKSKIPCFTSFEPESNESKCGGAIYYADKGLTVYIQRDYFLMDEKFKGKMSVPLMGAKQDALFTLLGNPKVKDANWEAYQMSYGTLILYYNTKRVVNKVIMSTKTTDIIQLCE
jgi:hypothetical protein